MKTQKFRNGETVITPHGEGVVVGCHRHHSDPDKPADVLLYGVESDKFPGPSRQMPFFEHELSKPNDKVS